MDAGVYGKLFQALANKTRMELIDALRDGDKTVSELVDATGRKQNTVSYHLRCLTNCGFAEKRTEGNHRVYSLNSTIVNDLFDTIETHIEHHRQGIYTCEILEDE